MRPVLFMVLFGTSNTSGIPFLCTIITLLFRISLYWRVEMYRAVEALTTQAEKAVRSGGA